MNQHPSRLSRQELYSYGFKEGQPWGDDRRAMESALHAMDQLEREIQQNYIHDRTTPTSPWWALPSSRSGYTDPRAMSDRGAAYFQPRSPPDIRLNRSNASDTSQSSSGSEMAHWSGRQEEYGYPGFANGNFGGQSGRPDRHYYHHREAPAAAYQRPSVPHSQTRSHSQARSTSSYAPPITPSNSYAQYPAVTGDDNRTIFPEDPSYRPNNFSGFPTSPPHTSQQFENPSQMQLIRYGANNGSQAHKDQDQDHYSAPPSSPKPLSPGWSLETTRGSENISNGSSQVAYSDNSALSSSGYVESYNVHSYEGYYHDYTEDADHGYMSDGVASDEGVYYSSSEGPDDEEDVYSDGYSSPSDYYDDDSYGGDSD